MAKKTHYRRMVTVKGTGMFPTDMLRFDSCVPASEQDSHVIGRYSGERTVRLYKFALDAKRHPTDPALARWRSFGWPVTYEGSDE